MCCFFFLREENISTLILDSSTLMRPVQKYPYEWIKNERGDKKRGHHVPLMSTNLKLVGLSQEHNVQVNWPLMH